MTHAASGRRLYGLAAILFGGCAFAFHDFNAWEQIRPLGHFAHREVLLYGIAAAQIAGGIGMQWKKTAGVSAAALGIISLFFAILWLPIFVEKPQVYDSLGNFFEQFSLASGALIVFATTGAREGARRARLARIGYYCFCACVVSFTLEQAIYLRGTADFVPSWLPPGQMFWAIATTICFALAAIALLTGRLSLLAARLLTGMIVGFGLFVWLPALIADPHSNLNWNGNAENGSIAGSAWIVADYLSALSGDRLDLDA